MMTRTALSLYNFMRASELIMLNDLVVGGCLYFYRACHQVRRMTAPPILRAVIYRLVPVVPVRFRETAWDQHQNARRMYKIKLKMPLFSFAFNCC